MATEVYHSIKTLDLSQELSSVSLGDARRNRRYASLVTQMALSPSSSIPKALEDSATLQAYYRLMRHPNTEHLQLLEPHFDQTTQRCLQHDTVLVAHDTAEFAFQIHDEPARELLPKLSKHRQGFLWHASIAMSLDGQKVPLGLINSRPFINNNSFILDEETRSFWKGCGGIYENKQVRWFQCAQRVQDRLRAVTNVIHVCDREAEVYQTLADMSSAELRFVIRLDEGHRVYTDDPWCEFDRLRYYMDDETLSEPQLIQLGVRSQRKAKRKRPARRSREARIAVRGMQARLRKPESVRAGSAPKELHINVVEAVEIDPPEGEEGVRWLIATSEPIETYEDMWKMVEIYRCRWLIEEYFKSLKTGCSYLKIQHKNAHMLLNALAAKSVIAWHLLALRHLGRNSSESRAETVLNPVQIQVLASAAKKKISGQSSAHEAMMAVAQLGGHIKYNGPPGWLTLGRGWHKLLELERGFRIALNAL